MYQEKLRKQRENPETSRAGLKWEVEEDNALLNKIDENVSIDEIAVVNWNTATKVEDEFYIINIDNIVLVIEN